MEPKSFLTAAFASLMLVSTAPTLAMPIEFFSIDVGSDELVRLNAETGAVTVIGPLGFNADDTEMTSVNERLFALNSVLDSRVDLYEIDPLTGASLSANQVTNAGSPIISAEGLTHVGSQLKIGASLVGDSRLSESLADLALDGAMSNVRTFPEPTDFDGLAVDVTGLIYSSDGTPPFISQFFTVNEAALALTEFASFSWNDVTANDLVVVGPNVYGIDDLQDVVHQIDIDSGALLGTVNLARAGNYGGLALAPASAPEPQTLALVGLGVVLLALKRRPLFRPS